jgi:molybdopterin molybdotransferase
LSNSPRSMLSVDEALELVLASFNRLPTEEIDIADGLGRVLAENVEAENDLPPFANSSMDGYAVQSGDISSASREHPITLQVVGDIPAGSAPTITVNRGQAARIMTGAPMPVGADAIVPVEDTDDWHDGPQRENRLGAAPPAQITVYKSTSFGAFVRPIGEDVHSGQVILRERRILRAADLGVLAGLGKPRVRVVRRPRVAILSTGDELLSADEPLTPGKIRDMNGYTIAALVQQLGAEPIRLGIARDTADDVRSHLQQALDSRADVILSSAGVSVGAFDVVKAVIDSMGALDFWKVNMRPGKPLAFGSVESVSFLGLPGNPVSAMVSFDVFARPAILKMAGRAWATATETAQLGEPLRSDGRTSYIRVTLERTNGHLIAHSTGTQSSGVLSSLVNADGLLIIPAGVTEVSAGTQLQVRLFNDNL